MKKVLLVVVDALASRIVLPAIDSGRLYHLGKLAERGQIVTECVSVFPSITPAATASIVTGCYPAESGIAGAFWYDEAQDDVAYFGDDLWVILNEGVGKFFKDFLVDLNARRLKAPTAFEIVEQQGLAAACLNYLWFRGIWDHEATLPLLLKLIPGTPTSETIKGPTVLCLGDFVSADRRPNAEAPSAKGGIARRFGFQDACTTDYLLQLAASCELPDFTVAYFPDNDYRSHEVGPAAAVEVLEKFDETLGNLFDRLDGIDRLLDEVAVVIVGDHSQCDMLPDERNPAIELDSLLAEYELAKTGQPWQEEGDLMICPNMRAAQIYLRTRLGDRRHRLVEDLLKDPRVDQVIWRDDPSNPSSWYHVATSDRGVLQLRASDGDTEGFKDRFGNRWEFEGRLEAVDASTSGDGRIDFHEYPNAFERIHGAFAAKTGSIWVTAKPGYEFTMPETSVHPGGSHGSLHVQDSISPLIAAGVPDDVAIPDPARTIDVLDMCLKTLGVQKARQTGGPHRSLRELT